MSTAPSQIAPHSYEAFLRDKAAVDDRLIVMTAENRALIRNLPPLLGPRFIDTGITEQSMIGMAAGLALRGRIPFAHALAPFLTLRAFEFIRTDVGLGQLPVKLVGYVPGVLSDGNGATHQSLEDVSIMRGIPHLQVFAPASAQDLLLGMEKIYESGKPAYIRYNHRPSKLEHKAPFEIGKAEIFREGKDVAILTYGPLFDECFEACELLAAQGIHARLVNMRSLKPVDEAMILDCASSFKTVVTVEDHFKTGGLWTIAAETLLKHRKTGNLQSIAFEERWFKPATLPRVLEHEGLTGPKLAERIRKMMV